MLCCTRACGNGIVSLARRFRLDVAVLRGGSEPSLCALRVVQYLAVVEDEGVHRDVDALVGGESPESRGLVRVLRDALAPAVHAGQVVLRMRVPLRRR